MTPKKNRLEIRAVKKVFAEGRFLSTPYFTFKFIQARQDKGPTNPQISFIVPKSVAKLAVKRNLLRRRGYSALRKYLPVFPRGMQAVLVFKKQETDILTIENEIKKILDRLH
jgi:ribonuclease P protein component